MMERESIGYDFSFDTLDLKNNNNPAKENTVWQLLSFSLNNKRLSNILHMSPCVPHYDDVKGMLCSLAHTLHRRK